MLGVIVLLLGLFCTVQNNALVTTELEIESSKLPESFHGYRIVQLSDLHGKSFGSNQARLIQRVKKSKPDVIVFTGDLVDAKRYDPGPGLTLLKELSTLAPVYIISGNHEWWSGQWEELREEVVKTGAVLLEDDRVELTRNGEEISLLGVDDPAGGDVPASSQLKRKKGSTSFFPIDRSSSVFMPNPDGSCTERPCPRRPGPPAVHRGIGGT